MNSKSKPRKTGSKRTPKPSVPETPPESAVSAGLPQEESPGPEQASTPTLMSTSAAEPQSQLQAAAEDPCLSVDSHPWIIWISPPKNYPIQSPNEFGYLTVSYTVERGHPDCAIGRIEWSDQITGQRFPNDAVPNVQSWTNTRTFTIPYDTREQHILDMMVWNKRGPGRRHTELPFTFRDTTPPKFEIVSPKNGAIVPLGPPLEVNGWAEDRQSGVAAVEWSLDDSSNYQAASFTPDPGDSRRVNWRFQIQNLASGVHTIALRFRDKKGHQTARDAASIITITAAGAYKPQNDLASLRAYLEDLIEYAATHVKFTDEQLTRSELVAKIKVELTRLFYQPFEKLIDTYDERVLVANQPVNQLRAAIEVLRQYLAAPAPGNLSLPSPLLASPKHDGTALAAVSSAITLVAVTSVTEAEYRLAVYQALLNRIGTSYEELRLTRGAENEIRQALALRLGIPLGAGNDQLEQLYLPTDQRTEAKLEELFGLVDTTRDPFTSAPEPLLLQWRRDYLEMLWREQDTAEFSRAEAPLPIIDPDLIVEDDLRLAEPGNPAFDLWQTRRQWLADALSALKQSREAQPTALQGFDTIVSEILGQPVDKLLELEEAQKMGKDIEPELRSLHLKRQSFMRLLRVRKMAENNTISEVEWDDLYNILVQVKKQQSYQTWRDEETDPSRQIALTPGLFRISETVPRLSPWRATWRARLNWLDILQARIDQRQTTEDALRVAVSAAEEQTLPLLRDALITDLAQQLDMSVSEVADRLVHRLLVDLKTNASQRTTRLIQAIETVQGVLFALRAAQFSPEHPVASWKLVVEEGHFDEEWQWMGNYSTWRAAMFVYFFPETVLLPSLREPYAANQALHHLHRTKHFEGLLKELRKRPRLSPEQARQQAGIYLDNMLKDADIPMPDKLKTAINESRPPSPPSAPPELPTFLTDQHTNETLGAREKLCRDVLTLYGNQSIPNFLQEIFFGIPLQLAWQLQKSGAYLAALDWFQTVFAYNLVDKPETQIDERKIYYGLQRETNIAPILSRSDHWLTEGLNPHALAGSRTGSNPYTRYTLMGLAGCLTEFADSEFTRDTAESLARSRALYLTAERLLSLPDLASPTNIPEDATILPNPLLDLLQLRVQIQLTKMRQGRNIAGMKRQVELPVSLPPGPGDLPMIGPGGQLIIPGARPVFRPTPYYFRVLLERSKQLVNIAQQIEAAYLAALEKLDAENYNLLKANNDLQLAQLGEELQSRRVHEAQAGVGLAQAQRQRAVVMSEKYKALSGIGLSGFERQMISSFQEAIGLIRQAGAAGAEAAIWGGRAASYSSQAAVYSSFLPGPYDGPNIPAMDAHSQAGRASMSGAAAAAQAAILSANAQVAQTQASIAGVLASAEWRQKEFETQAAIAEQDIAIGEAQISVAQAHVGVAEQEQKIAQTQATQAQAIVDFLAKKFTNAELYEWMSGVLGEVYSYFLQQATAMAQLAENQLAFERQDTPPKLIRADYWEVPADTGSLTTTDQKAPDRKGLTGSARLLQDIYQLDQYAFETDKRKLNLSQTFSLARMTPFDFEQFRQTGVLTFATPMSLFDREFPGHYLRLIKHVRVSVIALIPPHHGIRATLLNSGISRVVTGGDVFQQVSVRRDPELVAFTSPINANGVFEVNMQPDMLLPFESMGVDTFWEFQMPRAANPFDFRTIADVLVTIDYTALHSLEYRQQVIKRLDSKISGERSFIFTSQFADAWYDLHNPEQSGTPMVVKFKTWREEFPANLDDLKIEQVLLFFSRAIDESTGEMPFEVEVKNLRFTFLNEENQKITVGGGATTIDGVISTRRGNGASWNIMIGKTPAGEWELELPNTDEVKRWFKDEKIADILLVITYGGRTPAWPA